jgi:D-sedoheptulose 7-phosphate isomerase
LLASLLSLGLDVPMDNQQVWKNCFLDARAQLDAFIASPANLEQCGRFSDILIEAYRQGQTVFSCGNGGSHCDAMHFAEEMTGRYRKDRRALGALALGDPSHLTCVSNDYGFEHVFARQIDGLGRRGDVLIGLSTSGNSRNVCLAFETARKKGIKTIALLGKGGGQMKTLADLAIVVPGETSDRIQELHIKLIHIVIETVERAIFPENYSA